MSLKINLDVLEEIYNNFVPHWSAVLISPKHLITRLISFTKNASNQRSIRSVYDGDGPSALWLSSTCTLHKQLTTYVVLVKE